MSNAYVCDRCGDVSGGTPALKVATGGTITDVGGVARASVDEERSRVGREAGFPPGVTGPKATVSIEGGDLCDRCVDEFCQWWGAEDTEDGQ